jgi:ElaB/YqjD/DUF883 family membrane-anchored ribosome-binding protein
MGERPDEVGRRDPLDADDRTPEPLAGEVGFDPATDAFEPDAINPDPTLREEAERDEIETTRIEIERTRADMGEKVDAIQQRLSPENLKEQAKDRVKEATVGKAQETGSGIVDAIKANPLPAALTGIGLGWLLMNARQQNSSRSSYGNEAYRDAVHVEGYPPGEYAPTTYGYPPRYEEQGTGGSSADQALGNARDKAGDTAGQVQDKAGELASRAQDGASQLSDQTRNQARRLSDQARYQARRAGGGVQRMLRENPLTVGTLAVGVGAAIGLAIPETGKEHEVMGEARDTVVDRVQEKAQETQQKVQKVAEQAQSAAQQEAENQDLTNQ